MRYEKGHKGATHDRILQVASRRFRQDGITGAGVAGIMSEAGLTNGAFYTHFSSKDEMIEKSLEQASDEQWKVFEKKIATGQLLDFTRSYLSKEHLDHPDTGCPAAALLPEISRQDLATRQVYARSLQRLLTALQKQLPGIPKGLKSREKAIASIGLLVGTLQMARAVDDPALSKEILSAGVRVVATLLENTPKPA